MNPVNEETPPVLQRDDRGGVTILTLNRPAKLNALSNDLLAAIMRALDDIEITRHLSICRTRAITGRSPISGWSFGSLARVSPTNASRGGDWSWMEILRRILSESDKRRSDKAPAD